MFQLRYVALGGKSTVPSSLTGRPSTLASTPTKLPRRLTRFATAASLKENSTDSNSSRSRRRSMRSSRAPTAEDSINSSAVTKSGAAMTPSSTIPLSPPSIRRSRRSSRAPMSTAEDSTNNSNALTNSVAASAATAVNSSSTTTPHDVGDMSSITTAASSCNSTDSNSNNSTRRRSSSSSSSNRSSNKVHSAAVTVQQPLPRVLILHTGGTLGMDLNESFEVDPVDPNHLPLKKGTGGTYRGLVPGDMLNNLFQQVPELCKFANMDLQVVFNRDSSNVGPREWIQIAKLLDKNREQYDAFLVVHGTDTLAYTASALSLMLSGFNKPIVMTGSQLPMSRPRSDARQNLIDALTCATSSFKPPHMHLAEVAVCFGGKLMRGNRVQKVNSTIYQAFDTQSYPALANLGVDVDWNERYLLKVEGSYTPRFTLEPAVIRIPIVPGSDPRVCYGDLVERGVKGIVLEAYGVGNMPDLPEAGWIPWLRQQTGKGLQVYMNSQCHLGPLHPDLYKAGAMALEMGVEAGPQMTPECAVVKMMLCLANPDVPVGVPLAGEM